MTGHSGVRKASSPDNKIIVINFDTDETFVKMAELLCERGIPYWYMPLAVYDERLIGVDPVKNTDETLDNAIRGELLYNPWYFYREILHMDVFCHTIIDNIDTLSAIRTEDVMPYISQMAELTMRDTILTFIKGGGEVT